MSSRTATAGFTLLEVVVAMTAAGVALALGTAAMGTTVDRMEGAEERVEEVLAAAEVRARLSNWIGSATHESASGELFQGTDRLADGMPDDVLTLITSSSTALEAERSVLRLFVNRSGGSVPRGLVAELRPLPDLPGRDTAPLRLVLDPDVVGLDARYHSTRTSLHRWLPSWISSSLLPGGVELRFHHDPVSSPHPLRRLPLRIVVDRGR